jgi:hypothetical protein
MTGGQLQDTIATAEPLIEPCDWPPSGTKRPGRIPRLPGNRVSGSLQLDFLGRLRAAKTLNR